MTDAREFDDQLYYDEWFDKYSEELAIKFAETGADRELDFNFEQEAEKEYNFYLANTTYAIGTSHWNIHRLR